MENSTHKDTSIHHSLTKNCDVCGNPGNKKCSQCQSATYCSQECQKQAWSTHKQICLTMVDVDSILQSQSKSLKFEDFEVIKQLGEGNFTQIFQVYHKKYPHKYYAMKICNQMKVKQLRKETDILMEKHVLNKIQDNIKKNGGNDEDLPCIKLIGTFKDESNLYFLSELMIGRKEVWESCRSFGMISELATKYTFYQICKCVKKIHDLNIIHRDLKPENMFFTQDNKRIKLIDFGSAEDLDHLQIRQMKIDDNPKRLQHLNFVGTSQYMSPECVRNKGSFLKSDIWSLGVILYQFYLGLLPFRGGSDYLIFTKSTEAIYKLDGYSEWLIPEKAKDLIRKMIVVNHEDRITIDEALNHELFEEVKDMNEFPEFNEIDQKLRIITEDFIKRGNVYKLEGIEKFEEYYENEVMGQFKSNENEGGQIIEPLKLKLEHLKNIAKLFIFDIEPDDALMAGKNGTIPLEAEQA